MTYREDDAQQRHLALRRATAGDARTLWEWANDEGVRGQSFSPDLIPWERHVSWLAARLESSDCAIWILERSGRPVGQVRYERENDGTAGIGFSVAAGERGGGLGAYLLAKTAEAALAALHVSALVGLVKDSNVASARAFLRAGYVDEGEVTIHGHRCRRFVLKVL